MPTPDDRRAQNRGDHDAERRQAAQRRRAAKEAREREERLRRYRKLRLHRTFAIALFCLAVAIAVSHVLEHAGAFQLMSPGWQDLLLGYPTAGLLAIIGGMLLPANR